MNMSEKTYSARDLLALIASNKKRFFSIVGGISLTAVIITLMVPPTYEVQTIIEPPSIPTFFTTTGDIEGEHFLIERESLAERIRSGVYRTEMLETAHSPGFVLPDPVVSLPGSAQLISVKLRLKDPEIGVKALTGLISGISKEVKSNMSPLKKQLELELDLEEKRAQHYKKKKEQFDREVQDKLRGLKAFESLRERAINVGSPNERLLALSLSAALSPREIVDFVGERFADYETKEKYSASRIERLRLVLDGISNIKVVMSPENSSRKVGPALPIVFTIAFILSLILALTYLLYKESK